MNILIHKWLAALFFVLISLSSLSVPLSVSAAEPTTSTEPSGDPPEEEEPECD